MGPLGSLCVVTRVIRTLLGAAKVAVAVLVTVNIQAGPVVQGECLGLGSELQHGGLVHVCIHYDDVSPIKTLWSRMACRRPWQ